MGQPDFGNLDGTWMTLGFTAALAGVVALRSRSSKAPNARFVNNTRVRFDRAFVETYDDDEQADVARARGVVLGSTPAPDDQVLYDIRWDHLSTLASAVPEEIIAPTRGVGTASRWHKSTWNAR